MPHASCWPSSFSGRHNQVVYLFLSHHVLRQKGCENPHPRTLPSWGLSGSQTKGISQSVCQAGAFCCLIRDAGRCELKSTDVSQEARADTAAASGSSHLIGPVPSHVTAAGVSAPEIDLTRGFLLVVKFLRHQKPQLIHPAPSL